MSDCSSETIEHRNAPKSILMTVHDCIPTYSFQPTNSIDNTKTIHRLVSPKRNALLLEIIPYHMALKYQFQLLIESNVDDIETISTSWPSHSTSKTICLISRT